MTGQAAFSHLDKMLLVTAVAVSELTGLSSALDGLCQLLFG